LVELISSVSAYPFPVNLVLLGHRIKFHPQVLIFDGFLPACSPAILTPLGNPFSNPFAKVLRIGMKLDLTGTSQCFQRSYRAGEVLAVVGSRRLIPVKLLRCVTVNQQRRPTAEAGVGLRAAVRINNHGWSIRHRFSLFSGK